MRFFSLLLFAVPATVSACEGDCIVGITNAFLGNYSNPVHSVFSSLAQQMSATLPNQPSVDTALGYLKPVVTAYQHQAYNALETAIFPSYFHGKCLDDQGYEPLGCPNPDCPIVCGTPGSLVHFYSHLRYIAYNQTYHLLGALTTPGSDSYEKVKKAVLAAAASDSDSDSEEPSEERRRGNSRVFSRGLAGIPVNAMQNNKNSGYAPSGYDAVPPAPGSDSDAAGSPPRAAGPTSGLLSAFSMTRTLPILKARKQNMSANLKSIMAQTDSLLEQLCGGSGDGDTNGLPDCSWEAEMKEYILSFP